MTEQQFLYDNEAVTLDEVVEVALNMQQDGFHVLVFHVEDEVTLITRKSTIKVQVSKKYQDCLDVKWYLNNSTKIIESLWNIDDLVDAIAGY